MATTKLKGIQIFDGTITAADIDDALEKEFTKARVTTDDSTPNFLSSKITAGTNVTLNVRGDVSTAQTLEISSSSATPGGSTTHVQYNSAGSFAGSANFTFNGSSAFLTGTFAQGNNAKATGTSSHAEGNLTIASGQRSHAEGESTTASGLSSHAEGYNTTAQGAYSHAQGDTTVTIGLYSLAAGNRTIASGSSQVVVGKYNKRNNTDSLFIVGDGSGNTDAQRDDIFLVNSGSVLVGSGNISNDTVFFVTGPASKNKSVFQGDVFVSGNIYGRYSGNNVLTNSSIGRVVTSITSSYSNEAPATTAGAVVANITLPAYTFFNTGDRVKCNFEIDNYSASGTRTINTYLSGSAGRVSIATKTAGTTIPSVIVNDFSIVKSGTNSQLVRGLQFESSTTISSLRMSGSTTHDDTQAMYLILELTASSVANNLRLMSYGVTFQGA